jgi:hypothetical protein
MKLTLACSLGCTLVLLLTACQGSPYEGESRIQDDPDQGMVDGMPEIIDDENDDNQDPNIGEPM